MKTAMLLLAAMLAFPAPALDWVTPDFFIDDTPREVAAVVDDCRARIEKIMCLVDAGDPGVAGRVCKPGGEAHAPPFQALYDAFPPVLQKVFCTLGAIYLESSSFGSAYGGLGKDAAGNPISLIGIRLSLLTSAPALTTWASWKEQLSFGNDPLVMSVKAGLPLVATQSPAGMPDGLFFIVAHEFGHVFDFSNQLNVSWRTLSWVDEKTALPENEFSRRKELCFYGCQGKHIPLEAMDEVYRDLDRTSFVSAYATTQPWDDFADSVAYFTMDRYLHSRYVVRLPSGATYDAMEKLKSARFAAKYRYIEDFLTKAGARE